MLIGSRVSHRLTELSRNLTQQNKMSPLIVLVLASVSFAALQLPAGLSIAQCVNYPFCVVLSIFKELTNDEMKDMGMVLKKDVRRYIVNQVALLEVTDGQTRSHV